MKEKFYQLFTDMICNALIIIWSINDATFPFKVWNSFSLWLTLSFSAFRAFPPDSTFFTSTILNLTCESTEESVVLKEVKVKPGMDHYMYEGEEEEQGDDFHSNSVEDIEETVEKNENNLHVANYLEMNPVPGSYGEFQCLAEKDKRVLHSWQYRVLSKCTLLCWEEIICRRGFNYV